MVLNQLKQIRDELKNSADAYDAAFKNTALIAAQELVNQESQLNDKQNQPRLNPSNDNNFSLNQSFSKEYFVAKYGNLKNAKTAYKKIYGEQKYGRSWSDFITVAKRLASPKQETITIEQRITKIENFLSTLGYQL